MVVSYWLVYKWNAQKWKMTESGFWITICSSRPKGFNYISSKSSGVLIVGSFHPIGYSYNLFFVIITFNNWGCDLFYFKDSVQGLGVLWESKNFWPCLGVVYHVNETVNIFAFFKIIKTWRARRLLCVSKSANLNCQFKYAVCSRLSQHIMFVKLLLLRKSGNLSGI